MNRWVGLLLVAVLFGVGGVLLWRASSTADQAREKAKQFVQQVVRGQWLAAYRQCTADLRKKYTLATFSRQAAVLQGATPTPQISAFANWGWSRVEMELKQPNDLYYEVELFVVREQSEPKISVFRFRKQDRQAVYRAAGRPTSQPHRLPR